MLLEKKTEFIIDTPLVDAINKLKHRMTDTLILQFFNSNTETRLPTDASSEDLGPMIEQKYGVS